MVGVNTPGPCWTKSLKSLEPPPSVYRELSEPPPLMPENISVPPLNIFTPPPPRHNKCTFPKKPLNDESVFDKCKMNRVDQRSYLSKKRKEEYTLYYSKLREESGNFTSKCVPGVPRAQQWRKRRKRLKFRCMAKGKKKVELMQILQYGRGAVLGE